ncbi:zinc-binding protein [Stutzerimonas nosocomialis]|uniref:Zinc-binding protein n=1 Tax=Stutzerimonas nosocomialis TaxID=1056496 RepID=A0A5R9QDF4_9GAMM|nr:putative zinc-binding protein [Stutzerimonas nosocomialis]TLX56079.1 zinc-binding protein [Stutzerimonas nosocomialis]TLX57606.1 zinc-binding protein [Stutzerimonas nosocomialis]TLX62725.1 zinc-binding protein [Stutzerimonas nosocomialis]
MSKSTTLPLVYSCSGCSNVAQLANTLAVRLDRAGLAEMSCIAGVGGRVGSLVNKANSGRAILAIDGCRLHCARACLAQHGVTAEVHITLSSYGLRKRYGQDCSEAETNALFEDMRDILASDRMQPRERTLPV